LTQNRRRSIPDMPDPIHTLLTRINGLHRAWYGGAIGVHETIQLLVIQEARRRNLRVPQEALMGFQKMPQEVVLGTFEEHEGTKEVQ